MGEPDQPSDVLQNKKCNFSIFKSEMLDCNYEETTKDMTESTHLFHWKYCINHHHNINSTKKNNKKHSPVFRWTGRQVNQSDNSLTDDKACPPDDFEPQFCDTRGWDASSLLSLIRDLNCFFPFLRIYKYLITCIQQPLYSI